MVISEERETKLRVGGMLFFFFYNSYRTISLFKLYVCITLILKNKLGKEYSAYRATCSVTPSLTLQA